MSKAEETDVVGAEAPGAVPAGVGVSMLELVGATLELRQPENRKAKSKRQLIRLANFKPRIQIDLIWQIFGTGPKWTPR